MLQQSKIHLYYNTSDMYENDNTCTYHKIYIIFIATNIYIHIYTHTHTTQAPGKLSKQNSTL